MFSSKSSTIIDKKLIELVNFKFKNDIFLDFDDVFFKAFDVIFSMNNFYKLKNNEKTISNIENIYIVVQLQYFVNNFFNLFFFDLINFRIIIRDNKLF